MTSARCPFCNIAARYPPILPSPFNSNPNNATITTPDSVLSRLRAKTEETRPESGPGSGSGSEPELEAESSHAYLILSTKSVLAFLDIMPLTRGHVLVVPREHYGTVGDVGVTAGRELGQWIPIISRAVMRTLFGDSEAHWNVVQNNGIRAAQVVPHVHFHIVPRPPLDQPPSSKKTSYVMFARGQRDELDEEEGEKLAGEIREELAREVQRVRDVEGVDLEGDIGGHERKRRGGGKL
ncbi:hypothetical protein SI65_00273 [Aspergillus cristatus]|uniref:HIT domain-containing protein n=1 Tax=Aspergillus cristatus TaxID=573508 RepID=A0A1E3BNZ3_ASPCR|nr:hypothetical protein SI65_00273 [Aspergillus cristatus]